MVVRARQTRAEPTGFAGSAASREGLETLPGFPLQLSSPPAFCASMSVCLNMFVGISIVVNNVG
jgi:hypothetical protein